MSDDVRWNGQMPATRSGPSSRPATTGGGSAKGDNLADILERVLDKGIVIAGDVQVNLLDIELLTIKLRLVVASVDKAKEMGIDWWERDPTLSAVASTQQKELEDENRRLRERLSALEGGSRGEIEDGGIEDGDIDDAEFEDEVDTEVDTEVEDGPEDGEVPEPEPQRRPRRRRGESAP